MIVIDHTNFPHSSNDYKRDILQDKQDPQCIITETISTHDKYNIKTEFFPTDLYAEEVGTMQNIKY